MSLRQTAIQQVASTIAFALVMTVLMTLLFMVLAYRVRERLRAVR